MGGLRGKLLGLMIVYAAGFASAIYYQAPALESSEIAERQLPAGRPSEEEKELTKGDILVKKVRADLKEFCSFAEEKASKVGALIKQRLDEQ